MKNIDSYRNPGIIRLGDDPFAWKDKPRTIIVLGVPRSGTSLIAGALYHLGVFMGDRCTPPVFEDLRLSESIANRHFSSINNTIQDYNNRFSVWGFKRATLLDDIARLKTDFFFTSFFCFMNKTQTVIRNFHNLHQRFTNPLYVITFKDVFSVAYRRHISSESDLLSSIKSSLDEYEILVKLLSALTPNALLVSYDNALKLKHNFISCLIDFCQLTPSGTQIDAATDFITHDPLNYYDISRLNKSIGFLDKVNSNMIIGWARYLNHERTAEVSLFIDGVEIQRTKANLFREDLVTNRVHSKGTCAFQFTNFDSSLLKDGSLVRVKVVDDISDIENSPTLYYKK